MEAILIKPPWATAVWFDSDWIYAEMQSVDGTKLHTVKVTNDLRGLQKILVLLRSRNAESRLSSRGEPTQEQIKRPSYDPSMVRRVRQKVVGTVEQRAKARAILREMGII